MLKSENKHVDWEIIFATVIMIVASIYFGAHILAAIFRG